MAGALLSVVDGTGVLLSKSQCAAAQENFTRFYEVLFYL